MPELLSYIVYGYIYLSIYNWISFKDNSNFENLLVKSIAASFILKSIYEFVFTKMNYEFASDVYKTITYIVISFVLGFVIGKIISHPLFNKLLDVFHVGRTTNASIWDDVIKPYTALRVFMEDGTSYYGQYKYGEAFSKEPIIVLYGYQKLDKDGNIIDDKSHNGDELIMLNTKDFTRIEVVYLKKPSKKVSSKMKN